MRISYRLHYAVAALSLILLAAVPALAEQALDAGNYVIHYNALSTDDLSPNVATAYGIVRSKNRAMLNISIIRKVEGTTGRSVRGRVIAQVSNLTGQLKDMSLRQVTEQEAVYYIGEVDVNDGETLIFTIHVTPAGESKTYDIHFKQQFFTE